MRVWVMAASAWGCCLVGGVGGDVVAWVAVPVPWGVRHRRVDVACEQRGFHRGSMTGRASISRLPWR